MDIGSIVSFKEDYEFNGKLYKKGHQFKITGYDNMRGFDLEDSDGNMICETRFISHLYEDLSEIRDKKIEKILKDEKIL